MKKSPQRTVAIGELTHKHFGQMIEVPDYPPGVLWEVQHVGLGVAHALSRKEPVESFSRVIYKRDWGGGDEGTRGLPPETKVKLTRLDDWCSSCAAPHGNYYCDECRLHRVGEPA